MSEKIVQLNEEVIKGQIRELVRGQLACCAGASGRFLVCADGIPIRAIQGGKRNGDLPGGVQHGLQALQCGAAAGCGACCAVRGILT